MNLDAQNLYWLFHIILILFFLSPSRKGLIVDRLNISTPMCVVLTLISSIVMIGIYYWVT
jgi:hypothetical protein